MGLQELKGQKQQQELMADDFSKKIGKLDVILAHLNTQLAANPAYLQITNQEVFKESLDTSLGLEKAALLLKYISDLRTHDKENGNSFAEEDFAYRLSYMIEFDRNNANKKLGVVEEKIKNIEAQIATESQPHDETNSPSPGPGPKPTLRKQQSNVTPPPTGNTLVRALKNLFGSSSDLTIDPAQEKLINKENLRRKSG